MANEKPNTGKTARPKRGQKATKTESAGSPQFIDVTEQKRLNDAREALYYYQKVHKRDPDFRDVKGKIRALTQPRSGAARPSR